MPKGNKKKNKSRQGMKGVPAQENVKAQNEAISDQLGSSAPGGGIDEVDFTGEPPVNSLSTAQAPGYYTEKSNSLTPTKNSLEDGSGDSSKRSTSLPSTFASSPLQDVRYTPERAVRHILEANRTGSMQSKEENNFKKITGDYYVYNYTTIIILCTILCAILAFTCSIWFRCVPVSQYEQNDFQNELHEIGAKFNIKEDTMLLIQSGIQSSFEKDDTSSLVFLYNDDKPENMDEASVKEFVTQVAQASAKFLRNNSSASHIAVDNSDLSMDTSSELLAKYKERLIEQGVLLFQDLENIPVNLAMAFHYYCDEYDPLVKKTAIFFTLNLANCNKKDGGTQYVVAERCMADKWSRIDKDMLPPLLTRVVNVLVDLDVGRQ